ncbi:cupin domain-containing protein [Heliorestis convoluta]|uniref:cupin domain-containing protein n=1 Tax=Heliorestis convoluta TaxID=356322 RepID=UPI00129A3681|nr:cupin domain-containing protein [Heliorestis convoluta]
MQTFNLSSKMVYSDKSLTKKVVYSDSSILSFVLNFKPGQVLPPHTHPGMVTIIQILRGTATFTVDGEDTQLAVGEGLVCQEQELLGLKNTGDEELSLYVTLSPGPKDKMFAEEF